jgi:outer membrane murein-binding lipoprotein Lpp
MDQFKVIRLVVLVVAVAGTASLSGCVSSSKYRALEASLSSERADLQGQIAALHTQKKALEEQKAALDRDLGPYERLTQLSSRRRGSAQKDEEMRRSGTRRPGDLQSEIKQGQIKVIDPHAFGESGLDAAGRLSHAGSNSARC